ncbi:MAG: biopolymer transporter ExbD [Firmicutes bacterium]|mgnify:FL=1|jgi:biopolymer transport protein ExbD|nr:biopolymer transporter ExbD [Bacillota bacterium]
MIVTRRKRRPRVEILPLIDVIFFILVFFMLFASFEINPAGLKVELPKAVTASEREPSNLTITVTKTGAMYIDGKAVATSEIQSRVRQAVQRRPDLFVIIRADKETRYEHVVKAMDEVRAGGGYRLGLAVERE